ncbi:MAG: hypothetical protein F6K54_36395, partial [Okeania sp. SIO3B5]|nr:hypothetical protein [Okeania sp. SIO3B5]
MPKNSGDKSLASTSRGRAISFFRLYPSVINQNLVVVHSNGRESVGGWGDGGMGRWGEGEMGRWGEGERGRWG